MATVLMNVPTSVLVIKNKKPPCGGFQVGVRGFEPPASRPPDVRSNRAELHPENPGRGNWAAKIHFPCVKSYTLRVPIRKGPAYPTPREKQATTSPNHLRKAKPGTLYTSEPART